MSDTFTYNGLPITPSSATPTGATGVWDFVIPLTASTRGNFPLVASNSAGLSNPYSIERVSIPTVTSVSTNIQVRSTASVNAAQINGIINVNMPLITTPGDYNIKVENKLVTTGSLSGAMVVVPTPNVTKISGSAYSAIGGTIFITGSNFLTNTGYTTVLVGGNNATISPGNITTGSITASVPAHDPYGYVDVIVTNRGVASITNREIHRQ